MYTILINNNKSLTTSVRTTLIRNSSDNEIQFLYTPPETTEEDSDNGVTVVTTTTYTPLLRYVVNSDGVIKSELLEVDEDLYKEKARFVLSNSAAFFNNRGSVEFWLDVTTTTETATTTTTTDEETGEETSETVTETSTSEVITLSTTLYIEEIPQSSTSTNYTNTISITRGDSLSVTVSLTDSDGYVYEPADGDGIWFRVKKSATAEDILIEKEIDTESLTIELVEEDTENLAFGEYKYEIEVITADSDHYTVIKNASFIITEELD